MFYDILKWCSQTWHTRHLQKCVVLLSFMIDHSNFQEWLYIDRIFQISIFSYFVVRSLSSARRPKLKHWIAMTKTSAEFLSCASKFLMLNIIGFAKLSCGTTKTTKWCDFNQPEYRQFTIRLKKFGSLATHREDTSQTVQMQTLIWVFTGHACQFGSAAAQIHVWQLTDFLVYFSKKTWYPWVRWCWHWPVTAWWRYSEIIYRRPWSS